MTNLKGYDFDMMKRIFILAQVMTLALSLFLSPALTSTAKANDALNAFIGIVQLVTFDLFADWLPTPEEGMVVSGNGVTLTHTRSFVAGCYVTRNAWSPDGRYLTATGRFCMEERVWDYDTGDLAMTADKRRTSRGGVAFTRDSKRLISSESGGVDNIDPVAFRLWDIESERVVFKVYGLEESRHGDVSRQMLIPNRGDVLINSVYENHAIEVLDLNTLETIDTISPNSSAKDMALHPTKPYVAFAQIGPDFVQIWDYAENILIAKILFSDGDIDAIAYAPDGQYLAIGNRGEHKPPNSIETFVRPDLTQVRILDANTQSILRTYPLKEIGYSVYAVAFSPDGNYLLASGHKGLYVLDAHSDRLLLQVNLPHDVEEITFHPNHNIVALTGDNRTSTWTLESSQTPSD